MKKEPPVDESPQEEGLRVLARIIACRHMSLQIRRVVPSVKDIHVEDGGLSDKMGRKK
jgi:hypothetical protein